MNKVFLSGYISRNPDSGSSARSGTVFSRASLAVNSQSSRGGQFVQYIDIVAFGDLARFIESGLHQGDFVIIEGQLSRSRYTNRMGQNTYRTNVVVESIISPKPADRSVNQAGEHAGAVNDLGYPVDAVFPPNANPAPKQDLAHKVEDSSNESSAHPKAENEKKSDPVFNTTTYRVDHPQDAAEEELVESVPWGNDIK